MEQLNPQYVVDDKGRKTAVLLSIDEYGRLLDELEDLADGRELTEAVEIENDFRNYDEIREELIALGLLQGRRRNHDRGGSVGNEH